MGATKKVKFSESEIDDNDFLQSIRQNSNIINKKEPATASEPTRPETGNTDTGSNATAKADTEKVLVNFKMNRATLERLRAYCKENDMTLTAGIKRAIRKMLDNE